MATYIPDPRPRLAKATRFFARLQSFDMECPACGKVFIIRKETNLPRQRRGIAPWDPTTARFRCAGCERPYILGIVAWPIAKVPHVGTATPRDQVPHPRQLAELRREGAGWWMADSDAQRRPRPDETNLSAELDRPQAQEDREDTDD